MIKRIHVNQHIIKSNRINGSNEPPISVIQGGKTTRYQEVEILGPCRIIHNPQKPLSCGARIWIETEAEIATK